MLGTYYTGDLAPINEARTRDYEAQTRRMGTDQAYLLGLLQGVNQGRQVGVNDRQVETGGLLGGLNYRLGQEQVGARNRETDVREKLGVDTLAYNREQSAVDNALRSTELSDRDRQYFAGLADAAAGRDAYLKSGLGSGVVAPGVQIEQLRQKQERENMARVAADAARRVNDALDSSIFDDANWDPTESPDDVRAAISKGNPKKLDRHKRAVAAAMSQLGPEVSSLIQLDPVTLRATPVITLDTPDPGAGLGGGIVQPVAPNRRAIINGFLGRRPFDPTLMLRQ